MNPIQELQRWYRNSCDGVWEHHFGVHIETLDNPGWRFVVDLEGTSLQGRSFQEINQGVGLDARAQGDDWMVCRVEAGKKFVAHGGPFQLDEMITVFIAWTQKPP